MNPIPTLVRVALIGGWIGGLIWFENKRALRAVRQSKIRRDVRNLAIAALAGAVMQAPGVPVAFELAEFAQAKRLGILPRVLLPSPAAAVAGILLLDYTLY